MRLWIHNDTECRQDEDAESGFEVEVVDASAFDQAMTALREIAKREGAFSMDQLTHANNTIENMATIAEDAITRLGGER